MRPLEEADEPGVGTGRRPGIPGRRRGARGARWAVLVLFLASGCTLPSSALDFDALGAAQAGLLTEPDILSPDDDLPERGEASRGSVWIGELLAVFPGMLVHGMGHYYAGDYKTARRLRHIGEFGYLLTAVGGGLGVGAYYLDKADQQGFAYSLYGTGGALVLAGVTYFFTAWIYDMIDTPRAVRSGGEPPPPSPFIEALDLFE